jgi:hypothetical protein
VLLEYLLNLVLFSINRSPNVVDGGWLSFPGLALSLAWASSSLQSIQFSDFWQFYIITTSLTRCGTC